MRTVRLHGELGKRFGAVHRLDVRDPAEAIRALSANYRGFREHLMQDKVLGYQCIVDGDEISEQEFRYPMSREFSIVPVITGGGKIGKIIIGVALIALAIMQPELIPVITVGGAQIFGPATVFWIGVGLTLSGVAQMLAPTPQTSDEEKATENKYFDGPVNTSVQGSAVPLGYGRMIVGSAVISAGMSIDSTPDPVDNRYFIGGFR